ncbi:glycosyltransferase involved in cell wall biosynthesis [Mucilaginibacter frigoritolerans]|uniref:Glycosyltransferase involved in cell wall biosynthesis n=1 Tax=Mucilaginibacter frigoritolerans TaxID=652788 RepID=A0A562U5Z2_9SPHI|nr:glycosyltransferase family 2 protein [Mucilaginibacter frigoritolerans]TWJ00787.1 glycosyltransferase involved in cell wall biosynthesis [Mucilaginibacter frigoritolerans]
MVSVLILTKNEENDLPGCLKSISWCDDIHVFDSFSDDSTIEIARKANATVTQRKFDGYASQRNAALESIKYKYDWLLILDADERIPESLIKIINEALKDNNGDTNAYRIRRKDYLWGTWLKHAQISPYYIRLVRLGKAKYMREINEVLEIDGKVEDLPGYFDHYPFSKGISHWLTKHNQYSTMEAKRWIEENTGGEKFSLKKMLFSRDFSQRRYHQKGFFYKLPFRTLIKWFYMVIWRRAFLDGRAGLTYAALQSIYEYFIVIKTREILNRQNN